MDGESSHYYSMTLIAVTRLSIKAVTIFNSRTSMKFDIVLLF